MLYSEMAGTFGQYIDVKILGEADYFVGGGDSAVRRTLMQLFDEDMEKRYEITHGYPRHYDRYLSGYVWVRSCQTWQKTAVVIFREEETIALNCEFENNKLTVPEAVEEIYFGDERQRCAKCVK